MNKTQNLTPNICRTCLRSENVTVDLINEKESILLQMLLAVSDVNVTENDQLPQKICSKCKSEIINSYNFKVLCENSDFFLREHISNQQGKHELVKRSNNISNCQDPKEKPHELLCGNLMEQKINESKKWLAVSVAYRCKKCDTNFINYSDLQKHNSKHNEDGLICKMLCKYCHKKFLHPRNLPPHIRKFHADAIVENCGYCDESFKSAKDIKMHLSKHIGANFEVENQTLSMLERNPNVYEEGAIIEREHLKTPVCLICRITFDDLDSYQKHTAEAHTELDGNNCKQDINLNDAQSLFLNPNYSCGICGKIFRALNDVKRHEAKHDPDKTFHCKVGRCKWSFHTNEELIIHTNVNHSASDSHVCYICRKQFCNIRNLRQHMVSHKTSKRFECRVCHKGK